MARAATAPARPRTAPAPRPRPARRRSGATPAPQRLRVFEAPAARLLDALLLGRAWIVLIGVLLAGIVFFNVSLLGLNQGITRDSERAQALQQQNAELRLQVAGLASSERIQTLAAKKGMTMPAAGQVTYLRSRVKSDAHRALARIEAPGPAPATTSTQAAAPPPAATVTAASSPAQTAPVAQTAPAAQQQTAAQPTPTPTAPATP